MRQESVQRQQRQQEAEGPIPLGSETKAALHLCAAEWRMLSVVCGRRMHRLRHQLSGPNAQFAGSSEQGPMPEMLQCVPKEEAPAAHRCGRPRSPCIHISHEVVTCEVY